MAMNVSAGTVLDRGTALGRTRTESALKTDFHPVAFPDSRPVRERLRAVCSDLVAAWKAGGGPPPDAKTRGGLQSVAETVCRRAGVGAELAGWVMVALVSEFWRERLSSPASGGRLVLLPDCPGGARPHAPGTPSVCGAACEVGTLWAAARDSGWTVLPTGEAMAAIGGLLTGQYTGVLGLAELEDLKKAFAIIPCFSLPIAAVPIPPKHPLPSASAGPEGNVAGGPCPAMIDIDTALGFLGVACGNAAPMADYLPVLREAAAMFRPEVLGDLLETAGIAGDRRVVEAVGGGEISPSGEAGPLEPLQAASGLSYDFLIRGGKFLRPFICLAAYDATLADRASVGSKHSPATREAAKAAAVAIEVFHKASLVHDDIEDDDAMRYGRPTVHRRHGIASAINAGDYLVGLGYRLIAGLGEGMEDPTLVTDLLRVLSDAHVRLARGQGAELWWRDSADKRLSSADALDIYALKTSPAFEAAIAMGIRLAGCLPEDVAAVGRYAKHVGTAFQILNDLKDWSGDVENQRRAAGDLLGGRPTVLLALATERLGREPANRLLELASGTDSGDVPVAEAAALFDQAGVFRAAGELVENERRAAVAAISTCRLSRLREVLEFLLDLAVPDRGVPA